MRPRSATTQPSRSPGPKIFEKVWMKMTRSGASDFSEGSQFAVVAELAVGVVLDDHQVPPLGDRQHRATAREAPGAARRVLEGGDHVEDPGGTALALEPGRRLVERLRNDSIGVARHAGRNPAELAAGLERDHVGRLLDQHRVTRIRERVEGVADPLLAATANEDLLRLQTMSSMRAIRSARNSRSGVIPGFGE